MNGTSRSMRGGGGFGLGAGGPVARDLLILIGLLFVTHMLLLLGVDELAFLFLTPAVYQAGFLWQLVTYPFIGFPVGVLGFLIALFMIYLFGNPVYQRVGTRNSRILLAWGIGSAAVTATVVQLLLGLAGAGAPPLYPMLQGQNILLTILVAAFATIHGDAQVLFMFVLPIRARWLFGFEFLIAFMALLYNHDLAGFVALCVAMAVTYSLLTVGGFRRTLRDLRYFLREIRLRIERKFLEVRIRRMRSKARKKPPKKDDDDPFGNVKQGPWVN